MGFPIGYNRVGVVLPRLLLNLLSLLDFIRNRILALLRHLGLSGSSGSILTESIPAWLIREMLPVAKFSEVAGAGGAETPESCAVCLYTFQGEEEIRRLRDCKHIFHKGCLDRWMEHDRRTCPLCRTPLVSMEIQDAFSERPSVKYLPIRNFF